MDYFLKVMATLIVVMIGIVVLILGLIVRIYGLTAIYYYIDKKVDKSNVCVIVDDKNVFCGDGYKVKRRTITENLQAPYFEVVIHGKNYWDIQNRYIGKDLKIINASKD
jgi:hypothetical protein